MLTSTIRKWFHRVVSPTSPIRKTARKSWCRPAVEMLEDRAVPAAVAPPSGMVAWWTADNSGVDLIGGNNATLYNGANYDTGKVAQAFNFDGVNDRAQVADSEALKLTASMTIETWVKVDAITPNNGGVILFRGDDRGGLDPYQLNVTSGGTVRFRIQSLTAAVSVQASLPLGVWTHVAATLDDATGSMSLYLNGALAAQTITTVRPFGDLDPASNPSIGIGNHGGYPSSPHNFPFDGQIDELSVYNRALTSGEVQGIFNAGGAGKFKDGNYFAVDAPTVVEGPAGSTSVATFTIWRVGSLTGQATADWTTANGTATAGSDFVDANGTVVFQDGESEKTVEITINGDATVEPNEAFKLVVSTTTPGFTAGEGQATIVNDDWEVSISDASSIEGGTPHFRQVFVPTNSGGVVQPRTLIFRDSYLYVLHEGNNPVLRFNAQTGAFVDIFVNSNPQLNGGLTRPTSAVFGPDGNLYIVTYDSNEVFRYDGTTGAFLDIFVSAGSGGLDHSLDLAFDSAGNLYVTTDITAQVLRYDTNGNPFPGPLGAPGTAVFVPSNSGSLVGARGIVFDANGDLYVASIGNDRVLKYSGANGAFLSQFVTAGSGGLDEPNLLTFGPDGNLYVGSANLDAVFRYSGATGSFIDAFVPSGSGGLDNAHGITFDSNGRLYVASYKTWQVLQYSTESEAVFTASLSSPSSLPISVLYATANGSAIAGSDYAVVSGTITFAPGQTSRTIFVPTLDDRTAESSETFTVTLSNAVGATITDGTGVGTIADNEPRISISDVTSGEGRNGKTPGFTFTISLAYAYDQAVTVSYKTVNGTATAGSNKDYFAQTGTITFLPGETTKTITILVIGDHTKEANELFYVDLFGNSSNSLIAKNRGVGTILNDD